MRPNYTYTKHTVTEDMDLRGRIRTRKEKLYEVSVESGFSYLKLLQLNGQNLSTDELKKQEDHEVAERQKMTDAKSGAKGDERENFLTAELALKLEHGTPAPEKQPKPIDLTAGAPKEQPSKFLPPEMAAKVETPTPVETPAPAPEQKPLPSL